MPGVKPEKYMNNNGLHEIFDDFFLDSERQLEMENGRFV